MGIADTPQISILLATYEPQMDWLKEQLISLNNQTYPNIKLFICDDASSSHTFDEIQALIHECITAFPFCITQNESNHGSNYTFERLTKDADGEFFAYCDQDDIWEAEKLQVLANVMQDHNVTAAYSDVCIIDEAGKITAKSITDIRKRHVFQDGNNLAQYLLVRNFVIGCTMLITSNVAKNSVPFEQGYIHDQWLAANAALNGSLVWIDRPLVKYRQHSNNQTGVLKGIRSKEEYYEKRILGLHNTLLRVGRRLSDSQKKSIGFNELLSSSAARVRYFNKPSIKDYKAFSKIDCLSKDLKRFECVLPFMSKGLFNTAMELIGSGRF